MKSLVTGLVLLAMVFGIVYGLSRIDLGERLPCAEDGCSQPHEIGSYFCRHCRYERWLDREFAKADARKQIMRELGWKATDLELKRVRDLADAIQRPSPQTISFRKKWDKEEQRRRNKILSRKGLLP